MDGVQWIKIKVGIFDGNSFKKIKRAKIGGVPFRDKLTAVWFELLDLAGKSNSNGYLIDTNEIPYSSYEDIAIMLDRDEKEIELCMKFFEAEKMVEIIHDVYCLSNWGKYQNSDKLDKIREQNRLRQAKWRENQKQLLLESQNLNKNNVTHNVTLMLSSNENKNIELDKEKEIYKEKESEKIDKNQYFISIKDIVDTIKKLYYEFGYKKNFARTNTTKKITTILKSKEKDKRLYPLQILLAYKSYLKEKEYAETEAQYVKHSDSFLSSMIYDYAEKIQNIFEKQMIDKYGENWNKIKFVYED